MVFQHFNLYPNKTVLENITLAPIKVLKQNEQEAINLAEKLLDRVGMLDKKIPILPCYLADNSSGSLLPEGLR